MNQPMMALNFTLLILLSVYVATKDHAAPLISLCCIGKHPKTATEGLAWTVFLLRDQQHRYTAGEQTFSNCLSV